MKEEFRLDKLFSDIQTFLAPNIPNSLKQAILDLIISSSFSSKIPVPLGQQILNTIKNSKQIPDDMAFELIRALLQTNPGGFWLVFSHITKSSKLGDQILNQLGHLIPEEHWNTNQFNRIRDYLDKNKQEYTSNADRN